MQSIKPVFCWIIVLLCMILKTGYADEAYYTNSYALVVGISKYASIRWKNLQYARSDAENVAVVLEKKGFEVLTLFDRDATRHAILARLEKNIAPRLQPNDRVLFYFSGHGYSKENGEILENYLIPYDKENIEVNASRIYISMSDLERQSKLMSIAKHQLFLIDAPIKAIDHSKESGIMLTDPDYLTMVTQKKARQLLAAGKNKIVPVESKELVHNVLTQLFVKGIDECNADINRDGFITCLELSSYISPRGTNRGQKIDYATLPGHDMGEFVFISPESLRKKIADESKELEVEDLTVEKKTPPPVIDVQEGRLYIKTVPENSRVRILNIVPPYRNGMLLSPGKYKVEVSNPNYQTIIQWITVANQDRIHKTIELKESRPYSRLYVEPDPPDARIRIMNIIPPYSQGMALQAGKYLIEIDKPGFYTFKDWVTISKGKDCSISPELQQKVKTAGKSKNDLPEKKNVEIMEKTLKPEKQLPYKESQKRIVSKQKESEKQPPIITEQKEVAEKQPKQEIKQELKKQSKQDVNPPEKKLKQEALKKQSVKEKETQKTQNEKQPVAKTNATETFHQKPTGQNQWQESVTGMVFVFIKGGCYEMGCGEWTGQCDPDEFPVHKVCVDDFWMGQYEVTQNEWQTIMEKNPSMSAYGSHYPVEKVSWDDVQTFIHKLKQQSKQNFRLPTEAQWEFACRSGGKSQKYSGKGLDINHLGWFKENSMFITHGVGIKSPNALNLFDMSGNVSEWCIDAYQPEAYKTHHKNNPLVKNGKIKVVRGGDWSDKYNNLRCSDRRGYSCSLKSKDLGFRLVRLIK